MGRVLCLCACARAHQPVQLWHIVYGIISRQCHVPCVCSRVCLQAFLVSLVDCVCLNNRGAAFMVDFFNSSRRANDLTGVRSSACAPFAEVWPWQPGYPSESHVVVVLRLAFGLVRSLTLRLVRP